MMFNSTGRLIESAKLLIIVAIAYTLATTGLYFISPVESANQPLTTDPADSTTSTGLNFKEIASLHLFGTATSAPVANQADNYAAPATRLKLELLGVFQAETAKDSAAIVAERGKPGTLYQIGDAIPGNAVLAEVYVDRIVIRRGGVYETLRFPVDSSRLSQGGNLLQNKSTATSSSTAGFTAATASTAPQRTQVQPTNIRNFIINYRKQLRQNPAQALARVGLTPVSPGDAQGYRLGNLANSPQLSRSGLQPNDVILSVNGQPVGNVQRDQLQLDNVLAQGSARLEVQRGSRRFFVTAKL